MRRHKIPTADYCIANSADEAVIALRSGKFGPPDAAVVVKADGLAAGKGVVVAPSRADAEEAVAQLAGGTLVAPDAAKQIVLEEALEGREVSILLFADGRDYALMPAARDHKRIGENDTGPNTGGMGAITDRSVLDKETLERIVREVVEPTLKGASQEGFPFRGVLFIGLMLTPAGPKVLEYNVRFGDPETQAILVRLQSDLFLVFQAMIEGRLARSALNGVTDPPLAWSWPALVTPGRTRLARPSQGWIALRLTLGPTMTYKCSMPARQKQPRAIS